MSLPVFRQGKWIQYSIPKDGDLFWNANQKFQAASFYATAVTKGFHPSQSAVLTECYINKMVYPGLQYNETLEKQIQSLLV
jgi:hypothetical protein